MAIIGVSSINYFIDDKKNVRLPFNYIKCIKNCGGFPVVIPCINDDRYIDNILNKIDGLLIPGGDDVNPLLYNERLTIYAKGIDDFLDKFQLKLIKRALKKDLPILGICRGHQLINIAFSGTLYQDISLYKTNINIIHDQLKLGYSEKDKVHEVRFVKDSLLYKIYGEKIMTNSFHHQIIKNIGEGLEALGHTKDGVVEALRSKLHSFVLSVQWHPERSEDYKPLFKLFINKCRNTCL